uniref:Uncharacterized protein n=1 Tax=Opuntia streptacantha TaxID=393608 RepID=A0A7C9CB96_OPUST
MGFSASFLILSSSPKAIRSTLNCCMETPICFVFRSKESSSYFNLSNFLVDMTFRIFVGGLLCLARDVFGMEFIKASSLRAWRYSQYFIMASKRSSKVILELIFGARFGCTAEWVLCG